MRPPKNGVKPNRLIAESSPYLLQHAYNPVDWYAWGEEAFQKAKEKNKLVLLSIGYSACHWCHVMAHESFENDSIAAYMNKNYVNIKVDREEYPDIDFLYQTFVQMTSGRGGWPLTVFLTAGRIPIFGGTYFPNKARHGMISFPQLLERIRDIYLNEPEKVKQNAFQIQEALENINSNSFSTELPHFDQAISSLFRKLQQSFDASFGGFSKAPKFPHISDMEFLLSYFFHYGQKEASDMVLFTLQKMAEGGIYDQLGGGFHRYSTDNTWLIPHFEKMLYDNALLIPLYVNAYRITKNIFFKDVALQTTEYVLDEFQNKDGAFYATYDADSDGEEGKYYLWDFEEIKEHLDPDIFPLFCEYYDVSAAGNFEGTNILHLNKSLNHLAKKYNLDEKRLYKKIVEAKRKLRLYRAKRVRPGLDDKILTDWNGMMIYALWEVFQMTGNIKYRERAENTTQYFLNNYLNKDGSLAHFVKSNSEKINGYLDDYAYYIKALIKGFEVTQKSEYLSNALKLTGYVTENFYDSSSGGLFITDRRNKIVLTRLRQHYDSSTPAGNNVMLLNFLHLYYYTGNKYFLSIVEQNFKLYKNDIESKGPALASMMRVVLFYKEGPVELTFSSSRDAFSDKRLHSTNLLFIPDKMIVHVNPVKQLKGINPGLIEGRTLHNKDAIFICYHNICSLPIHTVEKIPETMKELGLTFNK